MNSTIVNERFGVEVGRAVIEQTLALPQAIGLGIIAADVGAAIRRAGKEAHTLEMFVNDQCSRRCPYCYVARKEFSPGEYLLPDQGAGIARKFAPYYREFSVTGMEPLLPTSFPFLLATLDAAVQSGYRDRVIITNGDYLAETAEELVRPGRVTTLAVSLDGPQAMHDASRGRESFELIANGFRTAGSVAESSRLKLLRFTNTTITRANIGYLAETVRASRGIGADFAAFHPVELVETNPTAIRNLPALLAVRDELVSSLLELIGKFRRGEIEHNIVLECTAGTADVLFELLNRDQLTDFSLEKSPSIDPKYPRGAGYIYLVHRVGRYRLAIDLRVYPFHGDIVLRINPNGYTSACRWLARGGWRGGNYVLEGGWPDLLFQPETLLVHALAYQEYREAKARANLTGFIQRISRACETVTI